MEGDAQDRRRGRDQQLQSLVPLKLPQPGCDAIYLEQAWLNWLGEFFYYVFYISAGLAVFNLLPVPPLDGSKVVFSFLPKELYWKLMRYERYGMFLLMGLLLTGMLDVPLNFLREGLTGLLVPICDWTYDLLFALYIR